jgi:pimeloyl-ACP methyl ester carboxylesterase
MHVFINGVRLFFDVEGAKLVPDGPAMREKPTLLLLHGGPGFDHSIYKPAYSALAPHCARFQLSRAPSSLRPLPR